MNINNLKLKPLTIKIVYLHYMTEKELQILSYIKDNWSTMEPSIPIVIPGYKNRPGNIVQNLDLVSNNDIYVFVYEDDYLASAYDKYDNKPNVHFVKIKSNWRSIQRKRHFINEYFIKKPEIHDYIMIDDDIFNGKLWTIDKVKHNPLTLKQFLGVLEYAHCSIENRTISSVSSSDIEFGHWDFDKFFYKNHQLHQIYVFSNDFIIKTNIMFRDKDLISEDVLLTYDIMKSDYISYSFPWISRIIKDDKTQTSLASSRDKEYHYVLNTIKILGENARFFVGKSKKNFGTHATIKSNKKWPYIQPIVYDDNLTDKEKYEKILDILVGDTDKKVIKTDLEDFYE